MFIVAIFCDEIANNLLDYRLDLLWWDQFVTRLNDHGKDLTYLILFMRLQVTQQEGIELQNNQLMTANHS